MHGLKVNHGKQRWQRFDGDVLGIQWKDNKVVSMLSTIHKASDSVWCRRWCKDPHTGRFSIKVLKQPKAIQDYDRNMKGVDQSDQLIGSYSVLWRVKKYWKVLFFHLIDVSIVNAFVLWKEYQSQHPERADLQRPKGYDQVAFREALVRQLVSIEEADPVPVREKQPKLPKNAWNGASHLPVVDSSHGRCKVCTSSGVQSRPNVKCETCDVVLCLNNDRNCFYVYHTLDYQGGT